MQRNRTTPFCRVCGDGQLVTPALIISFNTCCQLWLSGTNSSASCSQRPKWTYIVDGCDNYALVPRRVVISIIVLLFPRRTSLQPREMDSGRRNNNQPRGTTGRHLIRSTSPISITHPPNTNLSVHWHTSETPGATRT